MRALALFLVTVLFAAPAAAHTGAGVSAGLWHGVLHPLGGLDHLLTMLSVGVFAALLGGRARWLVPASASGLGYAAGFLLATAALHASGLLATQGLDRLPTRFARPAVQTAGLAVAVTGVAALIQVA